jgi:hypothetical protein
MSTLIDRNSARSSATPRRQVPAFSPVSADLGASWRAHGFIRVAAHQAVAGEHGFVHAMPA